MSVWKRNGRPRDLVASERGAALVEIALCAPLLIFLAIGVIEIGTYMYDGIEVGNAAHAAVAYATQGSASSVSASYLDRAGIAAAAVADANDVVLTRPMAASTGDISVYYTCDSKPTKEYSTPPTCLLTDHVDTYVKVVAEGSFKSFMTFPGIPSTMVINRTAYQQVTP